MQKIDDALLVPNAALRFNPTAATGNKPARKAAQLDPFDALRHE